MSAETVEYEYRVTCADGETWDAWPADEAEARLMIEEYGDACGCEKSAATHLVKRRPKTTLWETVPSVDRDSAGSTDSGDGQEAASPAGAEQ